MNLFPNVELYISIDTAVFILCCGLTLGSIVGFYVGKEVKESNKKRLPVLPRRR